MSLVRFRSSNHPQQVAVRGATDRDELGTDPAFFTKLNARFHFTIDVAASEHNAKCERYFDKEANGLAQPWASERVFCNPPYSDIRPWVEKAWDEGEWAVGPELIVMLLPANRTEQGWWQDLVELRRDRTGIFSWEAVRVEFLRGRLRFVAPDKTAIGANERPPFGSCLLVWRQTGGIRFGGREAGKRREKSKATTISARHRVRGTHPVINE